MVQLVFYLSTNAAFCECRRLLTFSIVILIGQNNQASCRDTIPNPHPYPPTQHTNSQPPVGGDLLTSYVKTLLAVAARASGQQDYHQSASSVLPQVASGCHYTSVLSVTSSLIRYVSVD